MERTPFKIEIDDHDLGYSTLSNRINIEPKMVGESQPLCSNQVNPRAYA